MNAGGAGRGVVGERMMKGCSAARARGSGVGGRGMLLCESESVSSAECCKRCVAACCAASFFVVLI